MMWYPHFCSICPFNVSGSLPEDFEYVCASSPKELCVNKNSFKKAVKEYRIQRKLQEKKIDKELYKAIKKINKTTKENR